jgi:glycosyltransferase involved in cell wall biosynthesis
MADSPDNRKIFILVSSLVTGGAEVIVETLTKGLSASRFDIHILCLHQPGRIGRELINSGFDVKWGLSRGRFDPGTFFRLLRIFSKNKNAVLFSLDHHNAIFWGALAAKAAGLRKRILSVHSTRLSAKGYFNFTDRLVLPLYDRIVALSLTHASYLKEEEGVRDHQVEIINNGVDVDRFYPVGSEERRKYKLRLSIPENNITVTIVAALRPEKNHRMFLDAALLISKKRKDINFLVVGDGEEKSMLQTMANEMLPEGRVTFLGNRSDIPEILSVTDISVLCSFMEIFPVTVLEAMSAGLPVISTDVGSLSEMIRNDEDGILIQSEDTYSLTRAIEYLADNSKIRLDMGKRAREKVSERFSTKKMLSKYARLFEEEPSIVPD